MQALGLEGCHPADRGPRLIKGSLARRNHAPQPPGGHGPDDVRVEVGAEHGQDVLVELAGPGCQPHPHVRGGVCGEDALHGLVKDGDGRGDAAYLAAGVDDERRAVAVQAGLGSGRDRDRDGAVFHGPAVRAVQQWHRVRDHALRGPGGQGLRRRPQRPGQPRWRRTGEPAPAVLWCPCPGAPG